jgi:hypothetical protein
MQDARTQTYDIGKALLSITVTIMQRTVVVTMDLDTSTDASKRNTHYLVDYTDKYLPTWKRPDSLWWSHRKRTVVVKSGAQARRVIERAIQRTTDAVDAAYLDRERRLAELTVAFPMEVAR